MDSSQQAFTLGTICAAFLLIGILQPAPKKASMISSEQGWDRSTVKAFILAAVVLLVLTFGLDIAIESVR